MEGNLQGGALSFWKGSPHSLEGELRELPLPLVQTWLPQRWGRGPVKARPEAEIIGHRGQLITDAAGRS